MGKAKKLVIGILAAVLLFAVGFTAVSWYLGKGTTEAAPEPEVQPSVLYDAGEFVTNLADSNSRRFISVHIKLEVTGKEAVAALDDKTVVVRDRILGILRSRTYQEVSGLTGMNAVGLDIVSTLNELLGEAMVLNIYFSQFIVQ